MEMYFFFAFFIQRTSFHPNVGDKSTENEKCPCKVLPSSDSHLYSNKVQQFRKLIIEFRAKSLFFIILWCDFFLFLLCFGVIISFLIMFWCDYFRDVESGVLICFSSYRGIRVGNLLNPPAALNPITTCLHTTRNSFLNM